MRPSIGPLPEEVYVDMTEDKIKEIQYPTRRHAAAAATGNYKKVFRYWRGRVWGVTHQKYATFKGRLRSFSSSSKEFILVIYLAIVGWLLIAASFQGNQLDSTTFLCTCHTKAK